MGSRKPRSKVDRLPTDYEQPRRMRPQADGDFGAMLTLAPLTDEERRARAAKMKQEAA